MSKIVPFLPGAQPIGLKRRMEKKKRNKERNALGQQQRVRQDELDAIGAAFFQARDEETFSTNATLLGQSTPGKRTILGG